MPDTAQAGRKALEEPEPQAAHATGQIDRQGAGEKNGNQLGPSWCVRMKLLGKRSQKEEQVSGASSSSSRASERSSAWVTTYIDLSMQTPARFMTQSWIFSYQGAVVSCENSMWLRWCICSCLVKAKLLSCYRIIKFLKDASDLQPWCVLCWPESSFVFVNHGLFTVNNKHFYMDTNTQYFTRYSNLTQLLLCWMDVHFM